MFQRRRPFWRAAVYCNSHLLSSFWARCEKAVIPNPVPRFLREWGEGSAFRLSRIL